MSMLKEFGNSLMNESINESMNEWTNAGVAENGLMHDERMNEARTWE